MSDPKMGAEEVERLARTCLACWSAEPRSPEHDRHFWAVERVMELTLDGSYEDLWAVILAAYPQAMSDEAFASLAAGPVEDLLVGAGPAFIDAVEALAASDGRFNRLLGGVWASRIVPEVWARVERVRRATW